MGQVIVRNLDDAVVDALKQKAKAKGLSLEQELRDILTTAAKPTKAEILAEVDRIRAMTPPGFNADVEAMIREDRDSR